MNVQGNLKMWSECPWKEHGEEWSQAWGCTAKLWQVTVEPRIQPLALLAPPPGHWLEIGCGHGRMTNCLLDLQAISLDYGDVIGVDLIPGCVEYCRERFCNDPHARFYHTGGLDLVKIKDDSVSFVFSWDSLVHCDRTCLTYYLNDLQRVMVEGGYAFLHVSNLGWCDEHVRRGTPHLRDPGMSATWLVERLRHYTQFEPLLVEMVNWGMDGELPNQYCLIDAFVVFKKNAGQQPDRCAWHYNRSFMQEAALAKQIMESEKNYIDVTSPREGSDA